MGYQIEEQMAKKVQVDFVEKRKKDPRILQESFHLWLTLARLHCVSFGVNSLNEEIWNHMLFCEEERLNRINK